MAHVGNVNAQLVAALAQLQQADGIVNILGFGGIDGEDGQAAQIHAVGNLLLGHAGVLQRLCLGKNLLRELLADFPAVEDGLGTLGCHVGGAEALLDGDPMLRMTVAAQRQIGAGLITRANSQILAIFDQQLYAVAAVRLQGKPAIIRADNGAGQGIVGLGDLDHLALGAALHTGMIEQPDVDLVLGHCTVQGTPRDEDIPLAVIPAGKAEPGRQLDQCTRNGGGGIFVFDGGKTRCIFALHHGQCSVRHHCRDGIAQAVAVHLQFILQLPHIAGTLADRLENIFLQNCHRLFSSLTSPCHPAGPFPQGVLPCPAHTSACTFFYYFTVFPKSFFRTQQTVR